MENPLLTEERARATFEISELTTLLDGSPEDTEERHTMEELFIKDPNTPDSLLVFSLSPDQVYEQSLRAIKYFESKLQQVEDLPTQMLGTPQDMNNVHIRSIAFPYERPTLVHSTMFVMTLMNQGTEEQQQRWLPLVEEKKMIGAYAQTELGHGTNLKKLETTATYDPATEEFILNSPTLTSAKCWPGGLGRTSNHALVMAQLYINDKCYGIHMFLVQIRSLEDHRLLPDISCGELGPKFGVLATDNGFLYFNNVRIPRENMLMKFSQVLKDGTYVKPKFARSNYGTMVMIRIGLVGDCSKFLAQACTIAIRYNAVRKQGAFEEGGPEVKILDYQTQQEKLFPQIALSYALAISFQALKFFYIGTMSFADSAKINEIHALVAGMKGLVTDLTCGAVETCRRACGGLGYLQASGLPLLYTSTVAQTAYEGDNTVLLLQTARFLVKSMKMIMNGEEVGTTVQYLKQKRSRSNTTSCMLKYLELFEITAARMIKEVTDELMAAAKQGKKSDLVWHDHTVKLSRCGYIHSQLHIIRILHEFLIETKLSNALRQVLEHLFQLLAIQWLGLNAYELVTYGSMTPQKLKEFDSRIPELLVKLRPNALALVDAFDFCDESLHTAIGCHDGRVYERLYEYWQKLPANKQQMKTPNQLLKSNL